MTSIFCFGFYGVGLDVLLARFRWGWRLRVAASQNEKEEVPKREKPKAETQS